MRFRLATDEDGTLRYVRRGNVWMPKVQSRRWFWPSIREWMAPTTVFSVMLGTGGLVGFYQARPELDAQGRVVAAASVDAIALSWNVDELYARAAPDLSWSTYVRDAAIFRRLRRLGPIAKATTCLGSVVVAPLAAKDFVTARYACPISWSGAQAVAVVSLRRESVGWKLTGFYVTPPAAAS